MINYQDKFYQKVRNFIIRDKSAYHLGDLIYYVGDNYPLFIVIITIKNLGLIYLKLGGLW